MKNLKSTLSRPTTTRPTSQRPIDSGLGSLARPLAEFVSASDDTELAMEEIVRMIYSELNAIERDANHYLKDDRS